MMEFLGLLCALFSIFGGDGDCDCGCGCGW